MKSLFISSLTYALIFQTLVLPVAIAQNQSGEFFLRDTRAQLTQLHDAQAKTANALAKLQNIQFLRSDGTAIEKTSLKERSGEIQKTAFAYEHNGTSHLLSIITKNDTPKMSDNQLIFSQTLIVNGATGELGRTKVVLSNTFSASDQNFHFGRAIADLETQVRTKLNQSAGVSNQAVRSIASGKWMHPNFKAACSLILASGFITVVITFAVSVYERFGHRSGSPISAKQSMLLGLVAIAVAGVAMLVAKAHDQVL